MISERAKKYIPLLQKYIGEKRINHSLAVEKEAIKLAKLYGESEEKASIAALLHDVGKNSAEEYVKELGYPNMITIKNPQLMHGYAGACIAEHECGIKDEDILNAIRFHTTGRAGMSRLEKIIYVSDLIEETRRFDGVEKLRETVYENLDIGTLLCIAHVIRYVVSAGKMLHPDSVHAYNDLIMNLEDKL